MTTPEQPPILCFVDTETTGLDPAKHDVWEVAIIRRTPAGDTEHHFQITADTDPDWADPKALEISRFHERSLVSNGIGDPDAARIVDGKVVEWISHSSKVWWEVQDLLRDAYLVGAVPSFDAVMVGAMLGRCGLKKVWHHRLICVETMAATLLGWDVPRGLGKSAEALGLTAEPAQAHTALGDARLAKAVYDTVIAQGRRS